MSNSCKSIVILFMNNSDPKLTDDDSCQDYLLSFIDLCFKVNGFINMLGDILEWK